MEDIIIDQWLRIPCDSAIAYDVTGKPTGKLPRTYGIRVLKIGDEFIKVFSPDLNKNVYIRKADLERK